MRQELKYLVSEADRDRLHARIAPFVRADELAGGDGQPSYTVRSVYFDTPDLRDYHEKLSGIQVRRKLRIRAYDLAGHGNPTFLEVKRKHGGAVWKDRAALDAGTVTALLGGGDPSEAVPPSERVAAARFIYRLRREARRPTLLVTYDREPLVGRLDPSLRITFDRRLRCAAYPVLGPDLNGLYAERGLRPALVGRFILEVKFDRVFPSWLRLVLSEFGLRRQALSKYVIGLDDAMAATPWRFRGAAVPALARLGLTP